MRSRSALWIVIALGALAVCGTANAAGKLYQQTWDGKVKEVELDESYAERYPDTIPLQSVAKSNRDEIKRLRNDLDELRGQVNDHDQQLRRLAQGYGGSNTRAGGYPPQPPPDGESTEKERRPAMTVGQILTLLLGILGILILATAAAAGAFGMFGGIGNALERNRRQDRDNEEDRRDRREAERNRLAEERRDADERRAAERDRRRVMLTTRALRLLVGSGNADNFPAESYSADILDGEGNVLGSLNGKRPAAPAA